MRRAIAIVLTATLCLFHVSADAKTRKLTLRKAITAKLVTINASALGGIARRALRLEVANNTTDTLSLNIEPALMFQGDDTTRQPLVTEGDETLVINAKAKSSIDLMAFCGNASAAGPLKGSNYTFKRQLDTGLISTLRFAKTSGMSPWLSQSAVWTYTNNKPLKTVFSPDYPVESASLVKYMAHKKRVPVPEYYIHQHINTANQGAVVRRGLENVFINLTWGANEGYRNVYVSVYKPDGKLYKRVENNIVSNKMGSAVVVKLSLQRDPPGKYLVRLHDDGHHILQEKVVDLGAASEDE